MNDVIGKKKKSLLHRIIDTVKGECSSEKNRRLNPDVPLGESLADSDEATAVASRRNQLHLENHKSSDAVVVFTTTDK
jgi:hypothetical protein